MTLKTRRPTGKPPWPFIVLAGVEKSGKTYGALQFSASDLVGEFYFIDIGEGAADQYGALPGTDYYIVETGGVYAEILASIREIKALPKKDGKPTVIALDSVTELWNVLSDEIAQQAKARGKDTITMDQWNSAKAKWNAIMDELRNWDGIVICTARLEEVAVMDASGRPTKNKEWKIKAEKNLPFIADAVVQFREPRKARVSGVRSLTMNIGPGEERMLQPFSIEKLISDMGIVAGQTAARDYSAPKSNGGDADLMAGQVSNADAKTAVMNAHGGSKAMAIKAWGKYELPNEGAVLQSRLDEVLADIAASKAPKQETNAEPIADEFAAAIEAAKSETESAA